MKHLIQKLLVILKILLIIFLILIKLNIIKDRALHILIELLFYVLLGIYIMYISYPFRKKPLIMNKHDNILTFTLGIIFLLTLNYKSLFDTMKKMYFEKS